MKLSMRIATVAIWCCVLVMLYYWGVHNGFRDGMHWLTCRGVQKLSEQECRTYIPWWLRP